MAAKEVLFINTKRNGYGIDQCGKTLTVGELISILEEFGEDTPVYFKNDNGYTYGNMRDEDMELGYQDEEDE